MLYDQRPYQFLKHFKYNSQLAQIYLYKHNTIIFIIFNYIIN